MASRTMRWTPRTAIHEMGSKDDTMIDTKDGKANETELKIDGTATRETCAVCLSHKYYPRGGKRPHEADEDQRI